MEKSCSNELSTIFLNNGHHLIFGVVKVHYYYYTSPKEIKTIFPSWKYAHVQNLTYGHTYIHILKETEILFEKTQMIIMEECAYVKRLSQFMN